MNAHTRRRKACCCLYGFSVLALGALALLAVGSWFAWENTNFNDQQSAIFLSIAVHGEQIAIGSSNYTCLAIQCAKIALVDERQCLLLNTDSRVYWRLGGVIAVNKDVENHGDYLSCYEGTDRREYWKSVAVVAIIFGFILCVTSTCGLLYWRDERFAERPSQEDSTSYA